MSRLFPLVLSLAAVLLASCQKIPVISQETSMRTALPVQLIPRNVPADPFVLQGFERVHQKFTTAVLYLEGDPIPDFSSGFLSHSQSPTDPIGLRLAAQDGSQNVVYLARPCGSYRNSKYLDKDDCPGIFKSDAKYSEAVIQGYMHALDNIKAYHDVTGFELVGYDGGAALAIILAAQRSDIVSLRTIAGNLDTKTTSALHNLPAPSKSYNPVDYALKLAHLPQRHFLGKLDTVTPPAVYSSYAQALGPATCNAVTLVDNADHMNGWVEQWSTLRTLPAACPTPVMNEPAPVAFDPATLDTPNGVDHGQK